MFFDFSIFGPGSCLMFFIVMIYCVFFQGRKKRRRRRPANTFSPPVEKNSPYPPDYKIHRDTSYVRPFLRAQMKGYYDKEDFLKTGDWIVDTPAGKEVFVNSLMQFTGNTVFMYYATNYEGLKNGSVYPSMLDIDTNFGVKNVRSIRIFTIRGGKGLKMSLTKEYPEEPEEMYFEFRGPDAEAMAENVRTKLYAKREKAQNMIKDREKRKTRINLEK